MTKTQVEREKEKGLSRFIVVMPKEELQALKVIAAKKGTSMNDLAMAAIRRYLRSNETR